ncbi:type IV pilus modification protein PilV [Nitrosomonas sp.]|uniref:type IV pilus modification protein PilV n=1 Tax=Nitrosomonas sp. TaxID=42353 RepID=UPI0035B44E19
MNRAYLEKKPRNNSGFSLIEVLITILIVSFGLLGMAALILSGARSNNIAHYRSIASKQTEDIADRMRANLAGVSAGAYNALTATIPASNDCLTNICNAAQVAAYDHAQWNTANSRLLPGGSGTVNGNVATGFEITLMWIEKEMNGQEDSACPGGTPVNTRCFLTRISP